MKPLGTQTDWIGVRRRHAAFVHQKYQHKEGGERRCELKKSSREKKSKYMAFDRGNFKENQRGTERQWDMTIQENLIQGMLQWREWIKRTDFCKKPYY